MRADFHHEGGVVEVLVVRNLRIGGRGRDAEASKRDYRAESITTSKVVATLLFTGIHKGQ